VLRSPEDAVIFLQLQSVVRRRSRQRLWAAAAAAALPIVLTALYVFVLATPMYSTEARFAIRGGEGQTPTAAPPLLSTGFANVQAGSTDGYIIRDFLLSRAAMQRLLSDSNLVTAMTRADADPFVRVRDNATVEQLYDAYSSNVSVHYNMIEQIVVLTVYAFEPEDAVRICNVLIGLAETFANEMNLRAREDWLRVTEEEVTRAEQRATAARLELEKWRNANANVDPATDISILTNLISQLEGQLSAAQIELSQLQSFNTESVQRRLIEGRIADLRKEIAANRARLGGGDKSLSAQISTFERLRALQDFAETSLTATRNSLEQARLAIMSQQKFVAVIAEPQVDRRAAYPDKLKSLATALVAGLALAFVTSLLAGLARNAV
jgi:capsular polysaccharide transport system permease protein